MITSDSMSGGRQFAWPLFCDWSV